MSIPLIQDNQKDSINASLIAIKREEERLQALIAEADKKIAQLNELKVNKSDIVDEVTLNNMQSVTSNAVAEAISQGIKRKWTETKSPSSGGGSNITWTCLETYGGLKICFGSATSARTSSAFGDIFYCEGQDDQWYYPSNFFTSTPLCLMEVSNQVSIGSSWFWSSTQTRGTNKTKTKMVCPCCAINFGSTTLRYDILAMGV